MKRLLCKKNTGQLELFYGIGYTKEKVMECDYYAKAVQCRKLQRF